MASPASARGLGVYRALLSIPHTSRFALCAIVAELPMPMVGMAMLIGVRQQYGSYTLAGALMGVMTLTGSALVPGIAHLIDARGQRRVTWPAVGIWVLADLAAICVLAARGPISLLFLLAPVLGCTLPFGAMSRARWTLVLRDQPKRLNSALSLSAVLDEFMWVIGNPVSAVVATTVSPLVGLGLAALAILLGTWGLLGDATYEPAPHPADRTTRRLSLPFAHAGWRLTLHGPRAHEGARAGHADAAPAKPAAGGARVAAPVALVVLCAVMVAYGAFQSTTGVAIVAFGQEQRQEAWSGAVIACFSFASMLSAIGYGARTWRSALWKRFYLGLGLLSIGCSALVFSQSMAMAAAIMFAAGLAQAPTWININQIVLHLVPASRFTETMALVAAMGAIGNAVGTAIAGRLIDQIGSMGGFVTIIGFVVVAVVIALPGLRTMQDATLRPVRMDVHHARVRQRPDRAPVAAAA